MSREDLAVAWFVSKGVEVYSDDDLVYIVLENEDETHVLLASSEVSFRADLQKGIEDGNE